MDRFQNPADSRVTARRHLQDDLVKTLTTMGRLVYASVIQSSGATGVSGLVQATPAKLADEFGLSERQVRAGLTDIRRKGVGDYCARHGWVFLPLELRVDGTENRSGSRWQGTKKRLREACVSGIGGYIETHYRAYMASIGDNRDLVLPLARGGTPPLEGSLGKESAAPQTPAANRLAGASRQPRDEAAGRLPAAALGPVEDDTALPPGCPDPFEGIPLAALTPPRADKPRKPHRAQPRICTARQAWVAANCAEAGISVVRTPPGPQITVQPAKTCPVLRPVAHLGGARAAG